MRAAAATKYDADGVLRQITENSDGEPQGSPTCSDVIHCWPLRRGTGCYALGVTPVDELATLLKPSGGGVFLLSTGRAEQVAVQKRLYAGELNRPGSPALDDEAAIHGAFVARLHRIGEARGFLLGAPSDIGAGYRRGANLGPWGIRQALLSERPDWPGELAALGVLDIGDVFVVPQLLHDDSLSESQRAASAAALYPHVDAIVRATLPVSPLSILERAIDLVFSINPRIIPLVMGGDHSNAWPVTAALGKIRPRGSFAIVQPDAHTDLLSERLGIKYCFATWSYHANELMGRGGRMVQVGIRATRYDRGHWERALGVRQFWADECRRDPAATLDAIEAHVRSLNVDGVYFSNDIDGTDESWASATGTPEAAGLEPSFVLELIRRLGRFTKIIAGDVMEVAPPLGPTPADADRTCKLAASYLRETMYAALGAPPPA